jgi:hypothetical protein
VNVDIDRPGKDQLAFGVYGPAALKPGAGPLRSQRSDLAVLDADLADERAGVMNDASVFYNQIHHRLSPVGV